MNEMHCPDAADFSSSPGILRRDAYQVNVILIGFRCMLNVCNYRPLVVWVFGRSRSFLGLLTKRQAAMAHLSTDMADTGLSMAPRGKHGNKDGQAAIQALQSKPSAADQKTYCQAIISCGRASHWQMALQVLVDISAARAVPNVYSFSAAISACKGSQWAIAIGLLSNMASVNTAPDVFSFSAAISACEKAGEWQMAMCLLAQMPAARVIANEISFNAGISACEKGGEWQRALFLLAQMPAARVKPKEASMQASAHVRKVASGRWLCFCLRRCLQLES